MTYLLHLDYIIILHMQVQCQLFCANRAFCDFVLWTNEDIHIERIYPDEELDFVHWEG